MNPLKSIRKYCLWCTNGQVVEIVECTRPACSLWPLRKGRRVAGVRPLTQIKMKCRDCSESREEIKNCQFQEACSLWIFRLGKNPNLKGKRKGRSGFPKRVMISNEDRVFS